MAGTGPDVREEMDEFFDTLQSTPGDCGVDAMRSMGSPAMGDAARQFTT